ncbi:N-acetylmuramoyl-L-alanine amidase [Cognatishimia sp. F0-27]|uniref:N-acetylmuramoyl-L-alanine amidase n=1 Tax=Cognatishimia sp. F0-27 TaxID=2816855 RepID=UPI001D0C9578|nr:N-acetylmuramoyl-L-alanine amidase [Cognatishimia sp. F0-27]MCC1491573.1 N-acetylmuramoyl-L-alanine amidase [Cognatishimia sp. F0-27]
MDERAAGPPCDAADALWCPSENHGPRRCGARPDIVLLHYTAMTDAVAARDWLCTGESQVSAHYVLAEDGRLWQLVREEHRAWHAGAGAWGGIDDVNSASIGIEIANDGFSPFSEPQMARLERLIAEIMARWSIPPERVLGHSDVALGRKIDPGRRFDWARLARRGLAIRPQPQAIEAQARIMADAQPADGFLSDAARFGYVASADQQDVVLEALRHRFRPWAFGPMDATDRAIMRICAASWPVSAAKR